MSNTITVLPREQLRRERQRRGWSREYVAEQIGVADPKTIGRWERGVACPSSYFLQRLCTLFEMLPQDLGLYPIAQRSSLPHISALPDLPLTRTYQNRPEHEQSKYTYPDEMIYDPALPPPCCECGGLVGRETLLQQVKDLLFQSGTTFALTGLPGAGKTALAVELAYDGEVQQRFHDGILWVSLGPHPNISYHLHHWEHLLTQQPLAEQSSQSLPSPSSDTAALASALRAAIGTRHMLIVIDDVWKREHALPFLVGGPNCTYLLTTRNLATALQIAARNIIQVCELDTDAGLDLLARFVPRVVAREAEAMRVLVQMVGGLPLTLTIIGRYLLTQSYSAQPRRLRSALESLHSLEGRLRLTMPYLPPYGHEAEDPIISLARAIDTSFHQLSETAQTTLLRLSIFSPKPATFSEEAALSISSATGEQLDELVDAGLLEWTANGRYRLHTSIIDYALILNAANAVSQAAIPHARPIKRLLSDSPKRVRETSLLEVVR